jgi:hypothetical protein
LLFLLFIFLALSTSALYIVGIVSRCQSLLSNSWHCQFCSIPLWHRQSLLLPSWHCQLLLYFPLALVLPALDLSVIVNLCSLPL